MPSSVDIHAGQRVRQRRRMTGMIQQGLADRLGVRFQQPQKYETGANRISAGRLWDLATVLEVPVSTSWRG